MNTIDHNAPIGIFDSGVGGLTVFNALQATLPNESFVYLADLARIPYGTKGEQTIVRYADQIADYLIRNHGIKALVIACNTGSAHALTSLQTKWPHILIIGVIEPGAMAAVSKPNTQHIGVIATEGTVKAQAYQKAIQRIDPTIKVSEIACSLLVSLVEEGWLAGDITDHIIQRYLDLLFSANNTEKPDCLILGCTHFPLLKPRINAYLKDKITIIDAANAVADYTVQMLMQKNVVSTNKNPTQQFLVTDSIERFLLSADRFLKNPISRDAIFHVDVI